MPLHRMRALVQRVGRSFGITLRRRGPTRFMVITRGRTGSNLLLSLLRTHPEIRVEGEVIGEYKLRQPERKREVVELGPVPHVQRCLEGTDSATVIGFKILYYQVERSYEQKWGVDELWDVMQYVRSQRDIRVIHLKRRNRLRTLISIRVAALTKEYTRSGDGANPPEEVTVRLTPEECEEEFQRIGEWERRYDEAFADHRTLEVWYEDLAADMTAECDRVLEFLGVDRRPLTTSMKKQRRGSPAEVVENFDELRRHFEGTEYAWYFEDAGGAPD
jgi:LPS sulfotransferase NodH